MSTATPPPALHALLPPSERQGDTGARDSLILTRAAVTSASSTRPMPCEHKSTARDRRAAV
eukprot:2468283-Rhodomonas_salina.1